MEDGILQVLLQGGMGSIIVVAWHFFNKANMAAFNAILAAQSERESKHAELLTRVVDAQDKRAEALQETLLLISGQVSEVKHIASTKCPLTAQSWHQNGGIDG